MNLDMEHAVRTAEEDVGVIYMATCVLTGLSYIGQTVDFAERHYAHINQSVNGSETYFHRAFRKYGPDAFVWRFLAIGIPLLQLNTQEIFWIRFYNTYLGPGYNMTAGGDASPMNNPETVAKMRESHLRNIEDGNHIFVTDNPGPESSRQRIEEGTHNFLTAHPNQQRIEEGTHNFLTNNPGPEINRQRMDDGTHNFLTDHPTPKRIEEGTHNFLTDNPQPTHNLSIAERAEHGVKVSAGRHASKQKEYREERIASIEAGQLVLFDEES